MDTKDILKSFEPRNELNPKIWILPKGKNPNQSDGQIYEMKPEVRERLLEIANEFLEYIDVEFFVTDIVLTGSLANYNWSKYSDFDIHVIVNYNQFNTASLDLYKELFKLKKALFNKNHDIKLFGYECELYVEGEDEAHFSSGVFSLLYDEWQNTPKQEDVEIDKSTVKRKAKQWMDIIDGVLENVEDEDIETAKEMIDKYKDKLKKFRTCGLQKNGEYSSENLVFKILRRNGYLEKLINANQEITGKKLSMRQ